MSEHDIRLGEQMAAEKDRLLLSAIEEFIAAPVTDIPAAAERCTLTRLPDGKEVFAMDGVALVELFPFEFSTANTPSGVTITLSQKYRKLT